MKQHLADSVLNRLLNFADDLAAPPLANPAVAGAAIDNALAQPTGEMPAAPAIGDALIGRGLGLELQ